MPRLSNRLTALGLRTLPAGKHLDGAGLYLIKSALDSGRWMLRYRQFGRRRDMGLGGWPAVGLADARRGADAAPMRRAHLFLLRDVAKDCFEARKNDLRGDGVAGRWFSPLKLHVLPKLGSTYECRILIAVKVSGRCLRRILSPSSGCRGQALALAYLGYQRPGRSRPAVADKVADPARVHSIANWIAAGRGC